MDDALVQILLKRVRDAKARDFKAIDLTVSEAELLIDFLNKCEESIIKLEELLRKNSLLLNLAEKAGRTPDPWRQYEIDKSAILNNQVVAPAEAMWDPGLEKSLRRLLGK